MLRAKAGTVAAVLLSACVTAGAEEHTRAFTLGLVQRELKAGLSQADVVEKLGSPNILTRDGKGREAWVYDRVSTDSESSQSGIWVGGFGAGGGSSVGGVLSAGGGSSKRRSRTTQRTLTVTVRFSAEGSWHESRF
jgi:hypothetical protein